MKRCYCCRRVLWGLSYRVKVKEKEEPVTLCGECRQVFELLGRIEAEETEEGNRE